MLKKFFKILSLLLIILAFSNFLISYGTEAVTTSEADTQATLTSTAEDYTMHYGDLYLFDSNVVLDKIVYGNVYIFANNVEITGQIEGNLFVFCNKLKLDNSVSNGGVVGGNIFACANNIYYNGACTYLYAIANKLEMTYDSFVIRDAKIAAINADIKAGIGRDLFLNCATAKFCEDENLATIYGNLNYSSFKKMEIPQGVILAENPEENITYTNIFSFDKYSAKEIVTGLLSTIILLFAVYFILNLFMKKNSEKIFTTNLAFFKLIKAFGLGIALTLVVSLLTILLLVSTIGTKLAIVITLCFSVLYYIASPVLSIIITNSLKQPLKLDKPSMFFLVLSLVTIIIYALSLIPFIGMILSFIINITSIGLILYNYIPHKELTEEEKAIKIEAKKQKKENKEKIRQEKLEEKIAKKQAKLETKNKDNTDL